MRFKKTSLLCLLLLGYSQTAYSTGEITTPSYALTLNEAYGRTFRSFDKSPFYGSLDYGLGTSFSFEYRAWSLFSVGAVYDHLSLIQGSLTLDVDNLDLFGRAFWMLNSSWEGYTLLSGGMDLSTRLSSTPRENGYHGRLGVGVLYSLTQALAVDTGVSYQAFGPVNKNINYGDFHVGLQWRFGPLKVIATAVPSPVATPTPATVSFASPTPTPAASTGDTWPKTHKVLKGEDLWGIAAMPEMYNDGVLWPLILRANKDKVSDYLKLEPGIVLTVPEPKGDAVKRFHKDEAKPGRRLKIKSQHTVQQGEDLFGIARLEEVYGDGFLWPLLYDANKDQIKDARRIQIGMELAVPEPGNEEEKEATRERARAAEDKARP
jgi:hypothetical protein